MHAPPASVARLILKTPPPLRRALGGASPVVEGQRLDPQLAWILWLDAKLQGIEQVARGDVAETREAFRQRAPLLAPRPGRHVQDLTIPGPGGPLPARIHWPPGGRPRQPAPVLLFLHGGGFVVGDLETHAGVCAALARDAACAVLALDYRLAPEHPFPAAPDDAWAAWRWLQEHGRAAGLDPERAAVGGDSAGGNLAAGVARRARAGGGAPRLQVLAYPTTDVSCERESIRTFAAGYFLTAGDLRWFTARYLSDPAQVHDPLVSPLLDPDLSGVAPALVVTAGFDPLRDEGQAYAERLQTAGVAVVHHANPGLAHGFLNLAGAVPAAREALRAIAAELYRALHRRR